MEAQATETSSAPETAAIQENKDSVPLSTADPKAADPAEEPNTTSDAPPGDKKAHDATDAAETAMSSLIARAKAQLDMFLTQSLSTITATGPDLSDSDRQALNLYVAGAVPRPLPQTS